MTYTKFSSRDVTPSKRRDALAETYVPLCGMDCDIRNDQVDVEVAVRGLSRIAIGDSYIPDHKAHRTRSHIAGGDDSMLLVIPRAGELSVMHKKAHSSFIKPGEVHLIPLDSPFVSENEGPLRVTGINLPGAFLERHLVNPDEVIGKTISPKNQGAFQLLLGYADAIHALGEDLSEESGRLADLHLMDLVALTLGFNEESRQESNDSGFPFARVAAMRNFISEHKHNAKLNAEFVAQHFRVPVNTVRKIFRDFGTTFTDHVNSVRLDWVYEQILNPVANRDSISTLAYSVGFNNLAWFNRAFKRKFGITPSEVADSERVFN